MKLKKPPKKQSGDSPTIWEPFRQANTIKQKDGIKNIKDEKSSNLRWTPVRSWIRIYTYKKTKSILIERRSSLSAHPSFPRDLLPCLHLDHTRLSNFNCSDLPFPHTARSAAPERPPGPILHVWSAAHESMFAQRENSALPMASS